MALIGEHAVFTTSIPGAQGPQGQPGKDGKDGKDGQPGAPGGVQEAPNDGQQYARQSLNWSVVTGGSGGGIPEAPIDGSAYGRASAGWMRVIKYDGDIVDGGNY